MQFSTWFYLTIILIIIFLAYASQQPYAMEYGKSLYMWLIQEGDSLWNDLLNLIGAFSPNK